jgi:hypothetical protein
MVVSNQQQFFKVYQSLEMVRFGSIEVDINGISENLVVIFVIWM